MHVSLLFAERPPPLRAQGIRRRQPCSLIEPARQDRFAAERSGLACEDDEHRLRDFLGGVRTARLPQRDGVNQIHVPSDQFTERGLGLALRELAQQLDVIGFRHSPSNVRPREKGTEFLIFNPLYPD